MAVGHVRYSTTGANSWENSQPVWRADRREVALGHNGNLVNAVELHAELRETRRHVPLDVRLRDHRRAALHARGGDDRGRGGRRACRRLEGAYSTVVMTKDRVVAFRDPAGLRPLSLGLLGERYCVASESCAFDIIGAKFLRDVQPGEIVSLTERGHRDAPGRRGRPRARSASSSTSTSRGPTRGSRARSSRSSRGRMGEILAREAPVRRRPRDPGARLRQPRRARLRARERAAAGRRADQEPLRRAHVHPARPGAAQARPAAEVQPAARGRRRQAHRRRRRLDRARQHDAPDRADAARRRARPRCTCASPRRRSATPATTGSTCRRARR